MRIGGIDFVRSGEGFSLRGCPEFWFVTRDGLSAARWMGYYLEVPGVDGLLRVRKRCYGGCMLTNVPVYGNVVFLPEDGSCDGRGRIFRRVSEAGEDGILIEDLWERWFLLTPDGKRREVIRGLGRDPSPMGSGTELQPTRLSFGSPSVH